MARIRTIKPEFCTSEQVAECSTTARLLFVTMWCFCDDGGNHPASVRRLKMECFPGDAFDDHYMQSLVDELISAELLIPYEADSKRFWHVSGWKHQKIDRPSPKYPTFDESKIRRSFDDHSTSDQRAIDDPSPPEGKGREGSSEGKGMEGKRVKKAGKPAAPAIEEVAAYCEERKNGIDAEHFFDHYTANGWKQANGNPIRDWQAAVRTWEKNNQGRQGRSQQTFAQMREQNTQAAGDAWIAKMRASGGVVDAGK